MKYLGLLFGALTVGFSVWAIDPTGFKDTYIKNSEHIGGTGFANTKSMLEITSTTKGVLPPRMSTTQQNAISSPPEGLTIYDNVLHTNSYYNGSTWVDINDLTQMTGTIGASNISSSGASGASTINYIPGFGVSWTNSPLYGTNGTSGGSIGLRGSTTGTVTIQPQAAAGTYNFNLPITAGSAGQVLTSQAGGSNAMTWTSVLTNPMTTTGDIIYSSDNSGTPARLGIGTSNQVLTVSSGLPAWVSTAGSTPPTAQSLTSGTNYYLTRVFTVTSANATATATYTNNTFTCTVEQTISSGTTLFAYCTGDTFSSGTLTKSGGTGDSTITFSSVLKPKYIEVIACGGGGGGGASTSPSGGTGGGTTTFGSTIISCTGGGVGTNQGSPGVASAGTCTLTGVPSSTSQLVWNTAGAGGTSGCGVANMTGALGANSAVGNGGAGGTVSSGNGFAGSGFGAGGGGAGANGATNGPGGGGGSGGCTDIILYSPTSTGYAISIGGAGSAQSGTRSGGAGSQGGIIVKEYY